MLMVEIIRILRKFLQMKDSLFKEVMHGYYIYI
jgi:hypothetical protein